MISPPQIWERRGKGHLWGKDGAQFTVNQPCYLYLDIRMVVTETYEARSTGQGGRKLPLFYGVRGYVVYILDALRYLSHFVCFRVAVPFYPVGGGEPISDTLVT